MDWGRELYEMGVDVLAGTIGGCSGIVVGYPLDTVRIRLVAPETRSRYTGMTHAFRSIMRREGFGAFFRGITSPLVGNAPMNAVVFAGYGQASRLLERYDPEEKVLVGDTRPLLAGMWGGLLQCVIVTPVELVKCQAQTLKEGRGSLDIARWLVREDGVFRGLFRGFGVTCCRDVPSFGFYFLGYEWGKETLETLRIKMANSSSSSSSSASSVRREKGNEHVGVLMGAGAIGGVASWLFTYPIDVMKTSIQAAPPGKHVSIAAVSRTLFREGGVPIFWKGVIPTIIRAAPVNAVTLMFYEMILRHLKK